MAHEVNLALPLPSSAVLFMDEPTSGLDARAAAVVMRSIQNVVRSNRTVCITIHQPSTEIFEVGAGRGWLGMLPQRMAVQCSLRGRSVHMLHHGSGPGSIIMAAGQVHDECCHHRRPQAQPPLSCPSALQAFDMLILLQLGGRLT